MTNYRAADLVEKSGKSITPRATVDFLGAHDVDMDNLLLGGPQIEKASSTLESSHVRFALLHHPPASRALGAEKNQLDNEPAAFMS